MTNLILNTDSYKLSHWLQYPEDTKYLRSYIESRGGDYDKTVFFGLQMILKKCGFDKPITMEDVDEANEIAELHGFAECFNYAGWRDIATRLKGRLPIKIMAVPEGSIVPVKNCLLTIENTDPNHPWLVSFVETMLLRIWYPITVASRSHHLKKVIYSYLEATSDDPKNEINFKLHDFGARGVSSEESAEIGGLAHLVSFMGSDTLSAIMAGRKYYDEEMAGYSIPASEHSTITSWGKENEIKAYENMINNFAKKGKMFACVSDSYDLANAIDNIWGDQLKMKLIASGATLVVRPDSGNPKDVVLDTVQRLEKKFGTKLNSKGYKVLHDSVRVIQGDGINDKSIPEILENLKVNGYSASNIAFGMGGGLLQQLDRDTLKFANKTCWGQFGKIINVERDIFKDPITDPGKRSKAGKLSLFERDGEFVTFDERSPNIGGMNALKLAYFNGHLTQSVSFKAIRSIANKGF